LQAPSGSSGLTHGTPFVAKYKRESIAKWAFAGDEV